MGLAVAVIFIAIAVAAVAAIGWSVRTARTKELLAADATRARRIEQRRADALASEVSSRDTVLSAMTEGVVLFAPDGAVAYANDAAREILGRRFGSAQEVTPAALRDAVLAARDAAPAAGSSPEPTIRQFETARAVVEASVVPSLPAGTVVVVARDVTAARRVERLRRDFVANASHELKTPVASILAIAETLRHAVAEDPDAAERFLARLESEAIRLSRLVRDLLELSRLEGELHEPAPVRLDHVVRTEAERLRPRAESAGLSLVVEHLEPLEVEGSEADLALLVHNLVDNAIRYTEEGGRIRVSLTAAGDTGEIAVDDTGIGIPSRDLDRVFERFYRVDPARSRETGGTGLGLAIVRHVAGSHDGEVRVESVLGAGSTFTVTLPATCVTAPRDEAAGDSDVAIEKESAKRPSAQPAEPDARSAVAGGEPAPEGTPALGKARADRRVSKAS
jgi:two-component system sensor histidine kinase SenX3